MRLGLLGGSFDPVHNGHIALARFACKALELDRALFLPSGAPPHKEQLTSYRLRRYLLDQALRQEPQLVVSDLDRDRGETTYTYHLLKNVRKVYPDAELFFLVGDDIVTELANWHRFEEALDMAQFVVFTRYNRHNWSDLPYIDRLRFVEMPPVPISSTIIRQRLDQGQAIDDLVPPVVAKWYRENE